MRRFDRELWQPETAFLPPLNMVLTFFDQRSKVIPPPVEETRQVNEQNIEKLIEKLREKEKDE